MAREVMEDCWRSGQREGRGGGAAHLVATKAPFVPVIAKR